MDKDINRIKVVLAEKGGIRKATECLVKGTKEPISVWQSSWDVRLLSDQNGTPMIASQQWRHISELQNCLMWN